MKKSILFAFSLLLFTFAASAAKTAFVKLPPPVYGGLCEVTKTDAGKTAMRITLRVDGAFAAGGAKDVNLLAAAIGVKGSLTVGGTYSDDNFDCLVKAADTQKNEVRLLVTPKKAKEEDPPSDEFFVIPVTY